MPTDQSLSDGLRSFHSRCGFEPKAELFFLLNHLHCHFEWIEARAIEAIVETASPAAALGAMFRYCPPIAPVLKVFRAVCVSLFPNHDILACPPGAAFAFIPDAVNQDDVGFSFVASRYPQIGDGRHLAIALDRPTDLAGFVTVDAGLCRAEDAGFRQALSADGFYLTPAIILIHAATPRGQ